MSQANENPISLLVSYSQISIFDGTLENPFNNWTEQHVRQGFSWRDGSVSFKTLIESGQLEVRILYVRKFFPDASSLRTISVPFVCQEGARIEIATITESHPVPLEAGEYQLVYETGLSESICWCRFSLVSNGSLEPRVIIRDAELVQREHFLMNADPA